MASDKPGKREDGREISDAPLQGKPIDTGDDEANAPEAEDKGSLEALDELWYLLEEVDLLNFLCRRTPRHVDAEEMA